MEQEAECRLRHAGGAEGPSGGIYGSRLKSYGDQGAVVKWRGDTLVVSEMSAT